MEKTCDNCTTPRYCMDSYKCAEAVRRAAVQEPAVKYEYTDPGQALDLYNTLRPELRAFVELMEQKLRKNDHKTGWRELPHAALFKFLLLEVEEFKVADEFLPVEAARKELVDIANFCLILHDRLGMLNQSKTRTEQL